MKETKKIFCHFSFYDQIRIQEKLEEMAEQGWMIHQAGNLTWTFKRMEPQKLRFSVTYFPGASEFDPGPTERELTKLDFCAQDGWKLALKWGVMQIFYNENENAVPIETEPLAQVENIAKSMRKNVLFFHLFEVALIAWYLFLQLSIFRRNPIEYLSEPIRLYQIPMWICLLFFYLHGIFFYFYWTRKAKRMAMEDGVFLPIQTKVKSSYILLAFSILMTLFAFGSSLNYLIFGLVWCGIMVLITLSVNRIKGWLKKRGASRRLNLVISMGSVFLFTILFIGIIVAVIIGSDIGLTNGQKPVGSYEYGERTWDIYDDYLPLEIGDLMEMEGNWSKEARHQETGLISTTEYEQRSLLTEPKGVTDLRYTVTDVKVSFLRDYIRQAALNSRQDEVHGDFILTDHYEPVDASIWDADEAYQAYFSDGFLNTYLVFWDNRIVEIKFYWEPTTDQIKTAAEVLRQS